MKKELKNFYRFTRSSFLKLEKILNTKYIKIQNFYRFEVINKKENRKLVLEIYPNIKIGKKRGNVISIYTNTAHLQLHFCSGFVVSDILEEVTFISETDGKISGLIIERAAGCALFANIDKKILSGDFTMLGPEVILSSIALSLTETTLPIVAIKNSNK